MVPFTIVNFNGLENEVTIKLRDVLGHSHELTLDAHGLADWTLGKPIQMALPNLPAEQRELLISGIPQSVWDSTFKEEE